MDEMTEVAGLHRYPLARRGFMMTGLISGFTLAVGSASAQAIHTDAQDLVVGEVQVPAADGSVPTYFARPDGPGPFPVLLVVEEIFGVHEYIKDVCRRFAKAGYLAVAPELYARQGDLSKMTDVGQIVREVIAKAPDAQVMSDLDATAAWAGKNHGDASRLGVTGFCRGGRVTWLYATHNPNLKAAVAWYGPIGGNTSAIQPQTVLDLADQIRCPLLGLYGGKDTGIPMEQVRAAEAKAKAAGKQVEIVFFPEAGHAFHADYRPSYNKNAAEDGWKLCLSWFKKWM